MERGSSDADDRTFSAKTLIFRIVYSQGRGRGLSQCRHFVDKKGGVNFCDFVWTSFTDGPVSYHALYIQLSLGLASGNPGKSMKIIVTCRKLAC